MIISKENNMDNETMGEERRLNRLIFEQDNIKGKFYDIRKYLENQHCDEDCECKNFCDSCIYQACREALHFMDKNIEAVKQYYDNGSLEYYKDELKKERKLNMKKGIGFKAWVIKKPPEDTPEGDFIQDTKDSSNFPKHGNKDDYKWFLRGACSGVEPCFDALWEDYIAEITKERGKECGKISSKE